MSLKAVAYRHPDEECPIELFLRGYDLKTAKGMKKLADITSLINHTAEHDGVAGGRFSKPLTPLHFSELCRPEGNQWVRIHYLVRGDLMVLLNAYKKPKDYPPRGKAARDIQKQQDEAEGYYRDFMEHPTHCVELGNLESLKP